MRRFILILVSCLLAGLIQAADILVLGLFKDMAILRVDGKQYKLRTGEASPEGIKLIAADSEQAVLEIDGRLEPLHDQPEFISLMDRIRDDLTRARLEIESQVLAGL